MFVKEDSISAATDLSATEIAAARWVRRSLGSWSHEKRVLALASTLFTLTRSRLRIGRAQLRLLRLAAIVHDVGRCVSEKRHPAEGAELILRTCPISFSPLDRRALAFLTRYHRGAVPTPANEEFLKASDPRRSLRVVLALLRVADALDSRQIESPQVKLQFEDGRLNVCCYVRGNVAQAKRVYARRKKFRMLEQYLGHSIRVEVRRKQPHSLATIRA